MFTQVTRPNPATGPGVARFLTVNVCQCGSENVAKRYVTQRGEVEGLSLSCRDCGHVDIDRL